MSVACHFLTWVERIADTSLNSPKHMHKASIGCANEIVNVLTPVDLSFCHMSVEVLESMPGLISVKREDNIFPT